MRLSCKGFNEALTCHWAELRLTAEWAAEDVPDRGAHAAEQLGRPSHSAQRLWDHDLLAGHTPGGRRRPTQTLHFYLRKSNRVSELLDAESSAVSGASETHLGWWAPAEPQPQIQPQTQPQPRPQAWFSPPAPAGRPPGSEVAAGRCLLAGSRVLEKTDTRPVDLS